MKFSDYVQHDAMGLAERVASGEVTASELLALAQERAAEVNPAINAIVRPMDAQAQARLTEDLSGPFAGVPFLLKDLHQDYAGMPTSWGSRALANVRATEHATIVERWLEAGVVIFGKTNTPEFGAKGITESVLFGPARNPWNTNHTPGGSSGGAAAAVAAGIIPCAGASDGGGSIRIPASCCGLFGLKAGRGVVPSGPTEGDSLHGMATQGVVSRTVRDSAAMFDVIAGPAADSPYLSAVPPTPLLDEVGAEVGRLRIGVQLTCSLAPEAHPEVQAGIDATVASLRALGHQVDLLQRSPFDDVEIAVDFLTIWFVANAQGVDHAKAVSGFGDSGFETDTLITAAIGRATKVVEYANALERRHAHVRRLAAFHDEYDLLLTPTTATPPPKVGAFDLPAPLEAGSKALVKLGLAGQLRHTPIIKNVIDQNLAWVPFTQLANLTGRPAMSVPLHMTQDGLPIGMQFVAPLGGEATLIRLASQLEEAAPWAQRLPVL